MRTLEDLGFNITHDWTENETETRSHEDLSKFAELDINSVKNCDLMIAIMNLIFV